MKRRESVGVIHPTSLGVAPKYPVQEPVKTRQISGDECVVLGEVVNSIPPVDACVPVEDLNKHLLVTGATGSGKTFTVATLVNRLTTRDNPFNYRPLVLDWHGEYGRLLKNPKVVDPFQLPVPLLGDEDPNASVDFASQVLALTPAQEYVLLKAFENLRGWDHLDLAGVIEALEKMVDESGWFRESRLSLVRKLRRLVVGKYKGLFRERKAGFLDNTRSPLVIDLSRVGDLTIRRVYVAALLKKIFDMAVRGEFGVSKLLVVVEEARNLLGKENHVDVLVKMLDEVRKFGVGLVVVSQSPSSLVEDVMVNTSTKIVHSVKSAVDLEVLDGATNMQVELREVIPYLDKGEAVLFSSLYKKPLLIKVV
ncbi:ATP-binding protein [Thermogladius sp. KZ2Tp1]|uniref:ATP-binding protein n=1 Tax=Thermogladius sp. KZ2Tp1 TaxID=3136289 RepID=UPI003DA88271